MKPLCDICKSRHESFQGHVFATNRIATNKDATNPASGSGIAVHHQVGGATGVGMERAGRSATKRKIGGSSKTKNRRDRETYNAYQREYMRKRRALGR